MGFTLNNSKGHLSLPHRLLAVITGHRLIKKGSTVLVGVSGGPDSVALLYILWNLRYELGGKLIVAHFNHRLRPQAKKDEDFVRNLASRLQLPFISDRAMVRCPAHGSVEDWARESRLKFFQKAARQHRASAVMLAHTQDDLAETVLMRVLRGSGLLGLRGILDDKTLKGVRVIRPLLGERKQDLREYLKENKLAFRTDRTNLSTKFFRNKVRLKLIPLLQKEYNADIQHALANLSQTVSVDYDFMAQSAHAVFARLAQCGPRQVRFSLDKFQQIHPALRRMMLRRSFEQLKGDLKRLSFDHMAAVEELLMSLPAGAAVDWPAGVKIVKTKTHLEIRL